MKPKTKDNVYKAFIGEAKAYFRLLAYAAKADEEELPQIGLLFRAIAEAERVHATRQMNLVKDLIVKDTDTNLETSFQREKSISENEYPEFLKIAEEEGETVAALAFLHRTRPAVLNDAGTTAQGSWIILGLIAVLILLLLALPRRR